MKKKGFTLIELLAVIVILAVIMVIAVPKILEIIDNSRIRAADSSLKLVKSAIKTQIATSSMSSANFIKEDECYLFDFENNNENADKLSLKNKEKIGGSIKYCNGKFEDDTLTFNGTTTTENKPLCKSATKLHTEICNNEDKTYYCGGSGYNKGAEISFGTIPETELKPGDAFTCDVNKDGKYNEETERFYYVTDLESDSNTAVLIYYSNTTKGVPDNTNSGLIAYNVNYSIGIYGPATCITNLPTTNSWKLPTIGTRNIKDEKSTLKVSNFNYGDATARLLTTQEVEKACKITVGSFTLGELDKCKFLLENTKYSNTASAPLGYWLESPRSSTSDYAMYVSSDFRHVGNVSVANASLFGVRPAIEVPKNNISY